MPAGMLNLNFLFECNNVPCMFTGISEVLVHKGDAPLVLLMHHGLRHDLHHHLLWETEEQYKILP